MPHQILYKVDTFLLLAILILAAVPALAAPQTTILYASPGGLSSGLCDSWANACELGYALAEVAKAADAASLAAAAEISQQVFEKTGDLQPTSRTWANAQAFASMNNSYLAQYGVNAVVTGITVDAGEDTVLVQVSANLERLFPSVVPDVIVTENGFAEIRAFTR